MTNDVLEAMKRIEWQKAKGHLMAMLECYMSEPDPKSKAAERDTRAFDAMRLRIDAFVENVEGDL